MHDAGYKNSSSFPPHVLADHGVSATQISGQENI